jgi:hypothetical protein
VVRQSSTIREDDWWVDAVGRECSVGGYGDSFKRDRDGLSSGGNSGSFKLVALMVLNSLIRSEVWISSLLTHESYEGEYPFHLTKYCSFLFHLKS